jgi:hypothetical protein
VRDEGRKGEKRREKKYACRNSTPGTALWDLSLLAVSFDGRIGETVLASGLVSAKTVRFHVEDSSSPFLLLLGLIESLLLEPFRVPAIQKAMLCLTLTFTLLAWRKLIRKR